MSNLKNRQKVVENILRTRPETRGDNFALMYYTYLELGYDVNTKSFKEIMTNAKKHNYVSFESITRTRRKIEEKYPELKDPDAQKIRKKEELKYIEYSK